MSSVERVQHAPFEMHSSGSRKIRLELVADPTLQCTQRVYAKLGGQGIIYRKLIRPLYLFHFDVEFGVLAGKLRFRIIIGKHDLYVTFVTDLNSDELFLESADELA